MTVGDIKNSLRTTENNTIIFRPNGAYSFIELDAPRLLAALNEITDKIHLVQAGIDEFTECEKILFELFMAHAQHG
jgi:hypothetical protein